MRGRSFRILTLNLWRKDHFREQRLTAVRQLVQETDPDFIAFQEVSVEVIEQIRELFSEYNLWPVRATVAGLMILSKSEWVERGELRLVSHMGRRLVWYRNDQVTIATVHLESTKGQVQARIDQLQEIFAFLKPYSPAVLVGDFNFAPDWAENSYLDSDFRDAWADLHPDSPGYTEDTDVNLMRALQSGQEKKVRFDRVLCKGPIRAHMIELVGTEPLAENPMVWPSDHFGLVCDIELGRPEPVKHAEKLLMLGFSQSEYGTFLRRKLGRAVGCLSVGADLQSPSLAYKADVEQPNEDALMIIRDGSRYFLAVADGHFGNLASHSLIKRLSEEPFPETTDELLETLTRIQTPELAHGSGTTLTVGLVDIEMGKGFGASTGDSSLVTISSGKLSHHAPPNSDFFYFQRPLEAQDWQNFSFELNSGDLLLLFTDGVNECHYRCPETSIQDSHIATLWEHMGDDLNKFAANLTKLALDGVPGNPGGQDNIAIVALCY